MVNQQMLRGHWDEVQGKLLEKWGELTHDELDRCNGNMHQIVGLIERKTGAARAEVEQYLEKIANRAASSIAKATEQGREFAKHAAENVSEYAAGAAAAAKIAASRAADQIKEGYAQTEKLVRRKPAESLAGCFGAGLITGVVVGLVLRSK